MKWKDLGKHVSNIVKINPEENIIDVFAVTDFNTKKYITVFTKNGMIKRILVSDLKATRYSKPMPYIKLKDGDTVANICYKDGHDVFITTHNGYGLRYEISEVPILGRTASGVKAISLKNDVVASGMIIDDEEYVSIITSKSTGKRIRLNEFERIKRARKGIQVIRDVKTNPYYITRSFVINPKHNLGLKSKEDIEIIKVTDLPIMDRYSTGSSLSKMQIEDVFIEKTLFDPSKVVEEVKEEKEINKEEILKSVDERIMTIDDFLEEIDEKGE